MKIKNVYMGRFQKDKCLLSEFENLVIENNITCGYITGIGAVQNLNIGYYNQQAKKYLSVSIDKPLEITNLTGNISLKEDKPFVHCHVTASDEKGACYGGHLNKDSKIFAFEYVIFEFEGRIIKREFDNITGLFLWEK